LQQRVDLGSRKANEDLTQMIGQTISAFCVLGIVILGMLVMTQAITFDQLVSGVRRFLIVVIGILVVLCFLKAILVTVILPWLVSLKAALLWLAVAVLVVIALALIVRIAISKFQN